MAERTKRSGLWLKLLAASGVLGGGGAGVYQYADLLPFGEPTAHDAALDAAQQAWGEDLAAAPIAEPTANPLGALPLPEPMAPPQPPPAASERYAATPLPFPLEAPSQPVARGQNPSDEYDEADAAPINPLRTAPQDRYAEQPSDAQQAFDDKAEVGPPPDALAAFGTPQGAGVQTVQAIEPIDDSPSAPLGIPPMPADDLPLAALPQAHPSSPPESSTQHAPAPFSAAGEQLPPMPIDEPNPLRELPQAAPSASMEPYQPPAEASSPREEHSAIVEQPYRHQPSASPQPSYDAPPAAPTAEGTGRPGDRTLEGRQQPTLAIQKFAPEEIQVGKPCKFLVKVRNTGQRAALDVQVRDEVPAGARLMATTPRADSTRGQIVWDIGTLSPGEERTLEMELTPEQEGVIGSVANVSFSAAASVQTKCTRPQLAIRMTAPSKVLVGQQQQIQIEIKNPGTGDATGVVILENVPENLRHAAGPTLEFEVGTLRPGETRRLQLNMVAESPGQVVNLLTAQADGNLSVDQKVEFEVVAPALEVAVDGPSKRYLERPADYTVKIGNPGTASARDLRLVTQLPRGMRFVKANNMGEYDPATHAVYWSLAELPAGESGAVQLTAVPVAAGDHQLQVKAESSDGLQDQASHGTQVEGIAALKFSVIDMEDPIEVGGHTEYEVRVANQGTKAAENVTVQVAAPAGVRVVSAAGDSRHRVQGGLVAFEPIRQLAPGSELTFRVRIEGIQPGDHRLVVEVGSDDLAQPVRKEESTRVFGDE